MIPPLPNLAWSEDGVCVSNVVITVELSGVVKSEDTRAWAIKCEDTRAWAVKCEDTRASGLVCPSWAAGHRAILGGGAQSDPGRRSTERSWAAEHRAILGGGAQSDPERRSKSNPLAHAHLQGRKRTQRQMM